MGTLNESVQVGRVMKIFRLKCSLPLAVIFAALVSGPSVAQPVHAIGTTADGKLWHTIRQPNGSWQPFGDVTQQAGQIGAVSNVATAFDGSNLHVVATTQDGRIWHTVRQPNGSWHPFGDVASEAGKKGFFIAVGIALSGSTLHVVGTTKDGRLWHTTRKSDGTWLPFGDVEAQAGNAGRFMTISAAALGAQGANVEGRNLPNYQSPSMVPRQRATGQDCGRCDYVDDVSARSVSGEDSVKRAAEAALRSLATITRSDPSWLDKYLAAEKASSIGQTIEGRVFLRINAIEQVLKR